jgi:hypothetical protein
MHKCAFSARLDGLIGRKERWGRPFDVIDKQVKTTADAVAGVRDGSTGATI